MPDVTGVSHIELTVRDADRSAGWYEQVLGMQRIDLPEEYRNDSMPAEEVNMMHPTAGLVLSLIQHESGEDADFSELRVGMDHLALAVESRSELEEWVTHFDGHDVPHSAISDRPLDRCSCFVTRTTLSSSFLSLSFRARPHCSTLGDRLTARRDTAAWLFVSVLPPAAISA